MVVMVEGEERVGLLMVVMVEGEERVGLLMLTTKCHLLQQFGRKNILRKTQTECSHE